MPTPIVSVLMSVHNGQDFLREAIESILNQTYRDFEFIVVDDASTDNSLNILKSFSDPRLKILEVEKNIGLVDALNLALKQAKGKYVARMDADDVSYPDRFAQQVARMVDEPNLVLLGTSYDCIDVSGCILRNHALKTDNDNLQKELIKEGNQFGHPTVMMRSQTVKSIGGYRKLAGPYSQDYDLWLRLSEIGKIANLSNSLLAYRIHDKQLSVNKLFKQRLAAEIYKVLATQRRLEGFEKYNTAVFQVKSKQKIFQHLIASDYMYWSNLYTLMGNKRDSRFMKLKAIWCDPYRLLVLKVLRPKIKSVLNHIMFVKKNWFL